MIIDWGFAAEIGGFGFGIAIIVLIILAITVWLIGLVINKFTVGEDKTDGTQKGT